MKTANQGLLYFLTFSVAGYVVFAYGFMPLGAMAHPDMKEAVLSNPVAIYMHAFASIIALVLGPFQLSPEFRKSHPNVHRWFGRMYLGVGVLIGGLAGLYLSQDAFGGIVARLGFFILAMLWIFTGIRAYLCIRSGNIEAHKKWMTRNFALTLAAVTLRIYIPGSMAAGLDFAVAYPVIAWLCWVPNLIFVEWRYAIARNTSLQPTPKRGTSER